MKHPKSVRDIMTKKLVTFREETNIMVAIETLLKYKISGAPVVDKEGTVVGILSEIDTMSTLTRSLYHREWGGYVRDFMSTEVTSVSPEIGIVDLAEFFRKNHFRRLPVIDHGKLVGQVSRRDVLRAICILCN
jgi:CBS domain-containing protein